MENKKPKLKYDQKSRLVYWKQYKNFVKKAEALKPIAIALTEKYNELVPYGHLNLFDLSYLMHFFFNMLGLDYEQELLVYEEAHRRIMHVTITNRAIYATLDVLGHPELIEKVGMPSKKSLDEGTAEVVDDGEPTN